MSDAAGRTGVYPGTFDPLHNGHIDIIGRGARMFERLVVGVATNPGKSPLFTLEERVALVREETASLPGVIEVMPFTGLLVDFAHQVGAGMILRGLRAVSDFDYEAQMTGMNARIAPDVETVFLLAAEHHRPISSTLVKEIGRLGGPIDTFLPALTLARTLERLGR